jgi:PrtD family type I secretion system ABC transporter
LNILHLESDNPVDLALRASMTRLVRVAVFSGAISLLTLSGSLYMLQVYDRVLPSRNVATLCGLSAIVLVAYVAQGFFEARRARMLARIGTLFDIELQEPIHLAIARLPLTGVKSAVTQQPLRDLDQIRLFLSSMGPTAFLDMPWIPIFLIALFVFHPVIGLVATFGGVAIVAMTVFTERNAKAAATAAMNDSAHRQLLADATRQNAEVVRALGMTGRLTKRWSEVNERYLEQNVQLADVNASLGSVAKMLRYVLQSAILGIGAYLVVIEQASGGIMIASSIMMGRALAPIEVALANWKHLVAARQGVDRLRHILKATAAKGLPAVQLPRPHQCLTVEDLTVSVPGGDKAVIANATFSLTAGAGLAILGASAAGKTTLIRAMVGVWPASKGVVRLDGATLDQWHPDELGRHIGYLPQDVALFDGTVAENIARFDQEAASNAILEAARLAGAHEMILRLPDGYATRIGERGAQLSAGQRQRIGLARAVFGNPFLVVLDEPNANLDAEGELALLRAIETLRRKQSVVIMVSHRPDAIAALNVAMVLYEGRVIAFGPREEIFARVAQAANARASVKSGRAEGRLARSAAGAPS